MQILPISTSSNCALSLIAKPQLEKGSPQGIQQEEELFSFFFFFFQYTIGLCSSIINHLGKLKEEVILILPWVQVELGFQYAV